MDQCTQLEKRHVSELYHIVKEKHNKPKIKDIHLIVNDMVHLLHYDDRVNDISNKHHTIELTLHTLFDDTKHHDHHYKHIITCYSSVIQEQLERERLYIKHKTRSYSCVIL